MEQLTVDNKKTFIIYLLNHLDKYNVVIKQN